MTWLLPIRWPAPTAVLGVVLLSMQGSTPTATWTFTADQMLAASRFEVSFDAGQTWAPLDPSADVIWREDNVSGVDTFTFNYALPTLANGGHTIDVRACNSANDCGAPLRSSFTLPLSGGTGGTIVLKPPKLVIR